MRLRVVDGNVNMVWVVLKLTEQVMELWGTYYSSRSLNVEGKTGVLKAVNGGREYEKDDDGEDKGLYCQHCLVNRKMW